MKSALYLEEEQNLIEISHSQSFKDLCQQGGSSGIWTHAIQMNGHTPTDWTIIIIIIKAHLPLIIHRARTRYAGMYASFSKGQGHRGIFSLVKGTLVGNSKFVLEHFMGTKRQWPVCPLTYWWSEQFDAFTLSSSHAVCQSSGWSLTQFP